MAEASSSTLGLFTDVIERYGTADGVVLDEDVPWVPYGGNAYFKLLRADVRNNSSINVTRIDGPGRIGRHQHHGEVLGFTLEGSWRYEEYDWVATPGSISYEAPGGVHTLVSDHPKGMKTLFVVNGNMDFFGDDDTFVGTQNVFYLISEYEKHCEKNGLTFNDKILY